MQDGCSSIDDGELVVSGGAPAPLLGLVEGARICSSVAVIIVVSLMFPRLGNGVDRRSCVGSPECDSIYAWVFLTSLHAHQVAFARCPTRNSLTSARRCDCVMFPAKTTTTSCTAMTTRWCDLAGLWPKSRLQRPFPSDVYGDFCPFLFNQL